ncbi:GntR family transcriptional regulator [Peptoniphilus porci]|uniref:HTH gntR-type domain-containing protein n=1 Tax=Peptoniphilus porci TaxID=2652280 RepID=A0A1U7M0G3_9FIRM|nr:GntR family transcriptional regulator [Peptoniphilus porci]OLR65067.1 hypothetical protein BIV18_05830 [Peptoniphilus porci]
MQIKRRENLTDQTYDILKKMILSGDFKPGKVVSINSLSQELNISRTPLTNAFQKLELENFVDIIPKQGVIIKPITLKEAREIYELRAALESFAAKKSFDFITKHHVDWIKNSIKIQETAVKNKDIKNFMSEDIKFHMYLLKIYDNTYFNSIIKNLYDRAYMLGVKGSHYNNRLKDALEEHKTIYKAILEKNKEKYVKAVEDNVIKGYINLTGYYNIY